MRGELRYDPLFGPRSTNYRFSTSMQDIIASIQRDKDYVLSEEGKRWLLNVYQHRDEEIVAVDDMEKLLQARYGSLIDADQASEIKATKHRILSELLTCPLTLSFAINKIYAHLPWLMEKEHLSVLILGSRAESTLPMRWWTESLLTIMKDSKMKELSLQHIGPEINQQRHTALTSSSIAGRTIQTRHLRDSQLALHNRSDKYPLLLGCDLIVAFNPGFAANHESVRSWKPTIELLMQTKRPVLATAHSNADLRRDLAHLDKLSMLEDDSGLQLGDGCIDMILEPCRNPFRSHQINHDPLAQASDQAIARNDYIYLFQGK
jgi:hypothetical protein